MLFMFTWTGFRSSKAAIKVHKITYLRVSIHIFVSITTLKAHHMR